MPGPWQKIRVVGFFVPLPGGFSATGISVMHMLSV